MISLALTSLTFIASRMNRRYLSTQADKTRRPHNKTSLLNRKKCVRWLYLFHMAQGLEPRKRSDGGRTILRCSDRSMCKDPMHRHSHSTTRYHQHLLGQEGRLGVQRGDRSYCRQGLEGISTIKVHAMNGYKSVIIFDRCGDLLHLCGRASRLGVLLGRITSVVSRSRCKT